MLWRTAAHLLLLGLPAAGAFSLRRAKFDQAAEEAANVVAPSAGTDHENSHQTIVRLQRRVARLTSALLNQTETTQRLGGIIAQHEEHSKKVDKLLETLVGRQSESENKDNSTAAGNTTEGSFDADDLAALAGPSPLELLEPPSAVNITEAANASPEEVSVFDVETNNTEKLALEDLFMAPVPLADEGLDKGAPEVAIAPTEEPVGTEKMLVSRVARAMREDIMRARAEHNQSALKEKVAVAKKFLAVNKKVSNKASEDANVTDTDESQTKTLDREALSKSNVTEETDTQKQKRVVSSNPLRAVVVSDEEVDKQVAESLKRWGASSPLRDSGHGHQNDKNGPFYGRGSDDHGPRGGGRHGANQQKVKKAGAAMLVASEADAANPRFDPQEKRARQKLTNRAVAGLGKDW